MRLTLSASALMLALSAPAQGVNKEQWGFIQSGDEARLFYGIPESDSVTIVFACEPKKKSIEIVTTVLPAKPKKGQPLKTTLNSGSMSAAHDGKIGRSSGEFHFEAPAPAEPKAVDLLKSGTALTIAIPGRQVRVPLRGVAKPLAQFEAACFGM
jgi:hypothetical protein